MWIKKLPHNFIESGSGIIYTNMLWEEDNIYVMDNHRVAAWCWLQSCSPAESYNFLHIDYHSDLNLDFSPGIWNTYNRLLALPKLSLEEFLDLRHDSSGFYAFSWDNYIRPIHKLYPNWFEQAFFACIQPFDLEEHDKKCISGDYKGFGKQANWLANDRLGELLNKIPSDSSRKWIINLDIDYFFQGGESVVTDSVICGFAKLLNCCLPNVQVLTIALSPSCCKQNGSLADGWRNSLRVLGLIKQHLPALSTLTFPL